MKRVQEREPDRSMTIYWAETQDSWKQHAFVDDPRMIDFGGKSLCGGRYEPVRFVGLAVPTVTQTACPFCLYSFEMMIVRLEDPPTLHRLIHMRQGWEAALEAHSLISEASHLAKSTVSATPATPTVSTSAGDHPPHYGGADDPYEAIKVIEAWGLNFALGSAIKYLCRAGKKDGAPTKEDLQKAIWYIQREIGRLP